MRAEREPHPEHRRKPGPKKWLVCPVCFKQSRAENFGRMWHYRGCHRSRAWGREALAGGDLHR